MTWWVEARSEDLVAFMRRHEWERVRRFDYAEAWRHKRHEYDVLLPTDKDVSDYDALVARALSALQQTHGFESATLRNRIEQSNFDIVELRDDRDSPHGTTSLRQGRALLATAESVWRDSARHTIQNLPSTASSSDIPAPRPTLPTFMNQVHFGQTERGSFVIRTMTRLPPLSERLLIEEVERPFARRVTMRAQRITSALVDAVVSPQGERNIAFLQAAREGASPKLCDDLVKTLGETETMAIDVNLSWASTHSEKSEVGFRFERSAAEALSIGAAIIRAQSIPAQQQGIKGWVTDLHHVPGAADRRITVDTRVSGRRRKAHIQLSEADYDKAVLAHQNDAIIFCYGTLVDRGNRLYLEDVSSVSLGVNEALDLE